MRPDQIVTDLLALPLRSVDEACHDAPEVAGVYSWWCDLAALPHGVPAVAHPGTGDALLYIGIAPGKPGSEGNLRQRLRKHTKGGIGSSTFRLGLAALLWEDEGWQPIWPTDRIKLENVALAALGDWQRENLHVQWSEVEEPWTVEAAVIDAMHPPMNRDHNEGHEFYPAMGAARDALRDAGRLHREHA